MTAGCVASAIWNLRLILMAYLQPWMLWVLPAVLLPIIIHLLNRLRYKTVHWAAMIFLLKANRAATRRAKIRQYLLLAASAAWCCFSSSGRWRGRSSAAGSARRRAARRRPCSSCSIARRAWKRAAAAQSESKRTHALGAPRAGGEAKRGQPLRPASKTSCASRWKSPTPRRSRPCRWPSPRTPPPISRRCSARRSTTSSKNKPGSAELWIASDLQASNWRPDSAEWQDIAARFAGLPQGVQRAHPRSLRAARQQSFRRGESRRTARARREDRQGAAQPRRWN